MCSEVGMISVSALSTLSRVSCEQGAADLTVGSGDVVGPTKSNADKPAALSYEGDLLYRRGCEVGVGLGDPSQISSARVLTYRAAAAMAGEVVLVRFGSAA
jgi:hypothetical protein